MVERGREFSVCANRRCEPIAERVREAFDREWQCQECGGDLRVLRRGRLVLGCECYPTCEAEYELPRGTRAGECECGLPAFEVDDEKRCLDRNCDVGG